MITQYLEDFRIRMMIIKERLVISDNNIDFRFVATSEAAAQEYMENYRKPAKYGWELSEVRRLNGLLDGKLPEDFQIYLEILGNRHVHFFDSYEAPRNPDEFLSLQTTMREYFNDPEMIEEWGKEYLDGLILPPDNAIHVCWHQGYSLTYIQPLFSLGTVVRSWTEQEPEKAKIFNGALDFNSEGINLLEYLEKMIEFLEDIWEPQERGKFIHVFPDGRAITVYPAQNDGFEPLKMPHKNYHVEATPELLAYMTQPAKLNP